MKRLTFILAMVFTATTLFAQVDTTQKPSTVDTIKIGGMVIIKKDDPNRDRRNTTVTIGRRNNKNSAISTAEWIFDLGFANWVDKTDYAAATSQNYLLNRPGAATLVENDFKLRTGKSVNVNIWIFMQRISLVQHYVNLKYGLGVELNNYRFKTAVSFKEAGPNPYASQNIDHAFVLRDSISFKKNKLAADYATIPFMLNFRTNPNSSRKGISLSAGVSIGYLYSSRNKQVSEERGKHKNRGDYDLEKWKFAYIGELGLGPAHLYGSYSPKSLFENGFKMMPYNIGLRFSNW
ncbi:MAG: outer membrane beta-barrel protein [Ginsengibacter sp.]